MSHQALAALALGIFATWLAIKMDARQRDWARMLEVLRQIEAHLATLRRPGD